MNTMLFFFVLFFFIFIHTFCVFKWHSKGLCKWIFFCPKKKKKKKKKKRKSDLFGAEIGIVCLNINFFLPSLKYFFLCIFIVYLLNCVYLLVSVYSLGEERANLSIFHTFDRFVLVWICRFPLPLDIWEGLRFVPCGDPRKSPRTFI